MEKPMELLLQELLQRTISLEKSVTESETELDEWNIFLDDRARLISEVEVRLSAGEKISDNLKQRYLAKVYEIDKNIKPKIEARQQKIKERLSNIRKTKLARQTYYDDGPSGYGAFFDRKK
ncbi:flagellar protein FliT [Brevibacillus thermoruber]|uniref:flagellar protein FliT n=1 Tax=Brevibacillus thermoruber TaxID=33942 RepID=UPI00048E710F|nr:flagellar protein FliT [Brevibacillus thermoruber]